MNESLDLTSRGGRLSADIQAVVAADYIRNLREETLKGFYGRLKQGVYPMPAPIGYLDSGAGKAKTIDPLRGPLIRQAFELYGSGDYSLRSLNIELYNRGLTARSGKRLSKNSLNTLLTNSFYAGTIYIRKTDQTFEGSHEPLVSNSLFDRVQLTLKGKHHRRKTKHEFTYRRLVHCICGHSLIGEHQWRFVYYRCQFSECKRTCVREELIDSELMKVLDTIVLSNEELELLEIVQRSETLNEEEQKARVLLTLNQRLTFLSDKLQRLSDAYIDGLIDEELAQERKKTLVAERLEIQTNISRLQDRGMGIKENFSRFLEDVKSLSNLHQSVDLLHKRRLLQTVFSKIAFDGKTPVFTLQNSFAVLAGRDKSQNGGPTLTTARRFYYRIIEELLSSPPKTIVA